MKKFAQIINKETFEVSVGIGTDNEAYKAMGMTEMNVEQAYDGSWYVEGHAPGKPQSVKEEEVRAVRSQYYDTYVDWYQSKPLLWNELDNQTKEYIAEYRIYLKDYTQTSGWYNNNPDDYPTWLEKHHPVR